MFTLPVRRLFGYLLRTDPMGHAFKVSRGNHTELPNGRLTCDFLLGRTTSVTTQKSRSFESSEIFRPPSAVIQDLVDHLPPSPEPHVAKLLLELRQSTSALNTDFERTAFHFERAKRTAILRGEAYLWYGPRMFFCPAAMLANLVGGLRGDGNDATDPATWSSRLVGNADRILIFEDLLDRFRDELGLEKEDIGQFIADMYNSINPYTHGDGMEHLKPRGDHLTGFKILCDFFFWDSERLLVTCK